MKKAILSILSTTILSVFVLLFTPIQSIALDVSIHVIDVQHGKHVKNGTLVMAKAIFPRDVTTPQIKPATHYIINALRKEYPKCEWFHITMSDDERSYNVGNYIAIAEYKEGNLVVTGGIPSDKEIKEIMSARKNTDDLLIRKPDDTGLNIYLAFRKIRDDEYKKGKYLSDEKIYPQLSKRFKLPVSKIREIHRGIGTYYMYKMGNVL